MKKIIIAVNSDFIKETYLESFTKSGFDVFNTKNKKEILDLAINEKPDIILIDTGLQGFDVFELVETIKKDEVLKNIPVIIYAQFEKKEERKKALDLEVKDFIVGAETSPLEVVRRIKIALGEQRSYQISIQKNLYDAAEFINDYDLGYNFKCKKCSSDLVLYMIRDLSKGENYFKISIICPKCLL